MENNEITFAQLASLDGDSYILIDVRDETSFNFGHIPGAVNVPADKLNKDFSNKTLVIYCKAGKVSAQIAESLNEQGAKALSLQGGYLEYLREHISTLDGSAEKVEESIRKKFHKEIFSKFCKAINDYDLIQPNDKIAVCISGGKDSMLMAKLFQELKRHNKFPFEVVYLVMDPGYSKENREIIESNAKMLNIPITIFETDIFENVFNIEKSPCYICARMRRGHLYNKAKELGCNKIALGHHFDDVIETILMAMLYSGQVQTMMPKLHSTNFEGMELIRPMYLIKEADIKRWRDYNKLHFLQCACKFTENCDSEGCKLNNTGSKRKRTKELIAMLAKETPEIPGNIFNSVENVNLSTLISYKDKSGTHNFLDDF